MFSEREWDIHPQEKVTNIYLCKVKTRPDLFSKAEAEDAASVRIALKSSSHEQLVSSVGTGWAVPAVDHPGKVRIVTVLCLNIGTPKKLGQA